MVSVVDALTTFLQGIAGYTVYNFSAIKSLDLQRSGDVAVILAPSMSDVVYGLGSNMIQTSDYQYGIRLYSKSVDNIVTASNYIIQNLTKYFRDYSTANNVLIMAISNTYSPVLKQRGVWTRNFTVAITVQSL